MTASLPHYRSVLHVLLLVLAAASSVFSQANNGGNGNAVTTVGAAATATGAGTTGTTATNATKPCVPNANVQPGAIFLLSPSPNNIQTSAGVVGGTVNITWSYDKGTVIPSTINIYYAKIAQTNALVAAPGVTPKTYYSNQPIASNLPGSTTSYIWTVSGIVPGLYQLRIVGDGLDPQYYMETHPGQTQCYKQGQAFPVTSYQPFVIADNSQLASYPDSWGPLSFGTRTVSVGVALLAGALLLI
ncbi:hypothetical protein BCR33DRAFT_714919 [Rhizoclosmatium globosum]|uniref:Uncharacterized protein n=1 Tax=Rhizoclosmatium globosum TaxID=329046 RepID=A0A1Y2CNE9_9FUNG|nr:hypothetical protein BCR33DRAFT_714919 [Rhizoclosmatium globosum]|eukprot:ORY47865.1 hypothetical protein BCR33DRAFT_714919 [Rhizoclosmatium globosum]